MFRTFDGSSQVGPTHAEIFHVENTANTKRIVINQMVHITSPNSYHVYQMLRDSNGANDGTLYQKLNNNGWTTTPNAQITISKLI